MNARIFAFDGLDCTGKSCVIKQFRAQVFELFGNNGVNVYDFHLTGPCEDYIKDYFESSQYWLAQHLKFNQILSCIRMILDQDPNAIIILDRTPWSEEIWIEFFGRRNI